jgi:hypothetical protein
LETFRINCWNILCNQYALETVEKCIEEVFTSNPHNPKHILVNRNNLLDGLTARHNPTKKDIVQLQLKYPQTQGIDDGELHLFAWLYAQNILPNALILISTADKAAITSVGILGWLDSLISLEQLLVKAGTTKQKNKQLRQHYYSNWLNKIKTTVRLDYSLF